MRTAILYFAVIVTAIISAQQFAAAVITDDVVKRTDASTWSYAGGTCRGTVIRRADGPIYEEVTVDGEFIQSIPAVSGSRGVIVSEYGSTVIPYYRNRGSQPYGININGVDVPFRGVDIDQYGSSTQIHCGLRGTVIVGFSIIDVENKKINSTLHAVYPGFPVVRVLGKLTPTLLAVVARTDSRSEVVYAVNEDGSDPIELKNAPLGATLACNNNIASGYAIAKYNNNWDVVDTLMYGNLYENARIQCAKGGIVVLVNDTAVAKL